VNKKILIICITLLATAMVVAPVMAKGPPPENVEGKNPNSVEEGCTNPPFVGVVVLDLDLPSEIINRWFGSNIHVIVKPADKFYNPTELDVGDNFMMWLMNPDYRGKWVHMTKAGYLGLRAFFGLPSAGDVPEEGIYIWGAKT
jgi:hypothetical protein